MNPLAKIPKSITFLLGMTILTGVLYPAAITLVAQLAFPSRANGSLLVVNGAVRGSSLLAQKFESSRFFRARPSASDYAYVGAGASNFGPVSADLAKAVADRRAAWAKDFGGQAPEGMAYASASGLDPDIGVEAALAQVDRVASARSLGAAQKAALQDNPKGSRDIGYTARAAAHKRSVAQRAFGSRSGVLGGSAGRMRRWIRKEKRAAGPVIAALGSGSPNDELVRAAGALARESGASLECVTIDNGRASSAEEGESMARALRQARSLGAEVANLPDIDVAAGLLKYASRIGASVIVVGQGRKKRDPPERRRSTRRQPAALSRLCRSARRAPLLRGSPRRPSSPTAKTQGSTSSP